MMKDYKFFKNCMKMLVMLGVALMPFSLYSQYCEGGPSSTFDSNVENVEIVGESGTSIDHNGCPGVTGVEDLTSQSVTLEAGETYTLSVLFGTCGGNFSGAGEVWIDWNQNFTFDPSESIGQSSGTPGSPPWDEAVDFTFSVPADAFNGTARMRVMQQEGGSLPLAPCGSFSWGSVMDFSVEVEGGVELTCTQPLNLNVDTVGGDFVDLSWEESSLGEETDYDWELRTDGDPGSGPSGLEQSGTLPASTLSATLDNLDGSTNYTFYIRSDCDGDTSSWASVSFATVPSNNLCSSAQELIPSSDLDCDANAFSATTQAATDSGEGDPSCNTAGLAGGDVWFSFTATSSGHSVDYSNVEGNPGSGFMRSAVYQGVCGDLEEIECSTSSSGFMVTGLTVGDTYYLRAWSSNTSPDHFNTFDICIGTLPPPATNDLCADAIELTPSSDIDCDNFITATTEGATDSGEGDPSCNTAGLAGGDVWFSFTATEIGHTVNYGEVLGSTGSGFMRTAIYEGVCGDLVEIECSTSSLGFDVTGLTVGETYYIRAWSSNTNADQFNIFEICVGTFPPPPSNDECVDATEVGIPSMTDGYNFLAEDDDIGFSCGSGLGSGDVGFKGVWYKLTGDGNELIVHTCDEDTDHNNRIAVFTGDCDSLECIVGDYNTGGDCPSFRTEVSFQSVDGEDYYILVSSSFSTTSPGNHVLTVIPIVCEITCPEDVVVVADSLECNTDVSFSAPDFGQFCDVPLIDEVIFSEDFDGCEMPVGWVNTTTGSGNTVAADCDEDLFSYNCNDGVPFGGVAVPASFDGCQAVIDDDAAGSATVGKHCVESPEIDASGGVDILSFDYQVRQLGGSIFSAEVWDGSEWISVFSTTATESASGQIADISDYDNSDFRVRFCYDDTGSFAWGAAVDNIVVATGADPADYLTNSYNNTADASDNYPVGTTEVTFTLTDSNDEEHSCSFNVTVNDEEDPQITCPADVTEEVDFGVTEAFIGGLVATASDNCAVSSIVNDYNDGGADASDTYPEGTTTVTFTATDDSGNTAECTTDVTVTSDDVPPIEAVCQDITVDLDGSNVIVDAADLDGGSSGGQGELTFTIDGSPTVTFDCGNIGANSVTVTVTDELDFSETCESTVTVQDNTAPVVSCEAEVVAQVENPGETDVFVTVPLASATDNCGVASLTNDFNDGGADASDTYTVGTTTVTYTAVDVNGNESTCVTSVVVQEDLSIVPICDDAAVDLDASGNASVDATDLDGGSFGGEGALSFSVAGAPTADFDCDDVGDNSVTLTVSDAAGNSATCESTVSVSDNIDPEVVCVSAIQQTVADPGDTEVFVEVPVATATDNCDVASLENSYNNGGGDASDVYPVGTTSLTYTAVDVNGNSAVCITTLTVEADLSVVAVCQDLEIALDSDGNANVDAADLDDGSFGGEGELTFSADGSASVSFDCEDVGENIVVLTVEDEEERTATCESIVTVEDNIPPQVDCQTNVIANVVNVGDEEVFVDVPLATASDNCGVASIENSYNTGGADASDIYPTGQTPVVYTVTDVNGNTATCQTTVVVVGDDSIVPLCGSADASLDGDGSATVNAEDLDGGSFGGIGLLSFSVGGASTVSFGCADLGSNSVVLTVTDEDGNTATCTATVNISDDIGPDVVCTNDVEVMVAAPADTEVFVVVPLTTATDNCSVTAITNDYNDGGADASDVYGLGTTAVTFTAVDQSGNEGACTTLVTVNPDESIVAICGDASASLDEEGNASVSAASLDNGSFGGIGDLTFTVNGQANASFDCSNIGENSVTLTVSDDHGNVGSCEATVTISDDLAPTVNCEASVEVMVGAPGDTEVFVNIPDATATDNCGVADIVNDFNAGGADASGIYAVGDYTITYTANDVNGNSAVCSTELTVLPDESLVAICVESFAATIDASGIASVDAADLDGGSFGGVGLLTFAVDGSATAEFDCEDLGENSVQLTVSDQDGNSETCETTVSIDLNGATEVLCTDNTVVALDSSGTGFVVMGDLIESMNVTCGAVSTSASQLLFNCSDLGENNVVITVTNILGEEASCTATVTVEDNNPPVAECIDLTLSITDADQDFFVNPQSLNGGSSAVCGELSFDIDNPQGYTCDDDGGIYTVTLEVTSAGGETATCESEVTIACVEGLIEISGNVSREFGDPVPLTEMSWLGTPGGISFSQGDGFYGIFAEPGSNAVVEPTKGGDPLQYVTTLDLVLIQSHILQIIPFDSPYKIIASDATNDGVVSTFDLVILQSLIVGLIDEYSADVWRFIPESYTFDDPSNPFGEDFPEVKGYQGLVESQLGEDWVAIKTGDVTDNNGTRLDETAFKVNVQLEKGAAGEEYMVFESAAKQQLFGYQLALDFDPGISVLEFIPSVDMAGMNDLNFNLIGSMARTNFYNAYGVEVDNGTELFRLRIQSNGNSISSALNMVDLDRNDRMSAEAYPIGGEIQRIVLGSKAESQDSWTIANLSPVPAIDAIQLEIDASMEGEFELEIYHTNGQLLRSMSWNITTGYNGRTIDIRSLSSGTYFIRIVGADKAESIPFIKMD